MSLNFHLIQKDSKYKRLEKSIASQKQELEQAASRCVVTIIRVCCGYGRIVRETKSGDLCVSLPRVQVCSEHSESETIGVLQQRVRMSGVCMCSHMSFHYPSYH